MILLLIMGVIRKIGGFAVKIVPIDLGFVKSFLIVGTRDNLILVDTGNPGDGDKIVKKINEVGYRPDDVSLIILTHGHRDHVGGVEELRIRLSARTVLGKEDVPIVRGEYARELVPLSLMGRVIKYFISTRGSVPGKYEGDELEEDEVNLKCFGIEGKIIKTPGHTEGSLSVVLDDGSAIVGDLVMAQFLFFGRASLPVFATDPGLLKESIDRILATGSGKIYTSHGGPFDTEELRRLT